MLLIAAPTKADYGIARTSTGNGYWIFDSEGDVFNFGDAQSFGSFKNVTSDSPVVAMAARPQDDGYWLVTAEGGLSHSERHCQPEIQQQLI